jgi:hypothetical protein
MTRNAVSILCFRSCADLGKQTDFAPYDLYETAVCKPRKFLLDFISVTDERLPFMKHGHTFISNRNRKERLSSVAT